jgi:cytoskeletal protein RodZ
LDELGSLLREAREAKGLTLAEAQEATRINKNFLDALEEGRYSELPTQVHVKGYLRNYARFLDLDPKPLLDRYDFSRASYDNLQDQQDNEEPLKSAPLPTREDQVFYDPVNMEISGSVQRESGSPFRIIIILALIASLALVANRFIPILTGGGDSTEAITSSLEEAVSSITNESPPPTVVTPDVALIPGAGEPITSTSRNVELQLPTPTLTRPELPATLETINLRLDITERAWMRVTIDDEVVYEGQAKKGDGPFEWEAQETAKLLSGNAAGVFVTINNIELGKLGGRAEVLDETWTATGAG